MVTIAKPNRIDSYIAAVVMILMASGTVFVFSASANVAYDLDFRSFYNSPALRQILFFPIAVAVMYFFSFLNYRRLAFNTSLLKSPAFYLLVLSVLLLIIVLFPRFGTEINRARRWLRVPLGPAELSFQPSELAKWSLVFFLAAFCDKFSSTIQLYWKRFVPACLIIAVVAALIVTEDFGTAGFVAVLAVLILLVAGAKYRHVLTLLPPAVLAFCIVLLNSPRRMQRITAFLNPDKWADSANYQASQSLIALGSGGFWGKGLGRGICKYGHLPEDTTDFIFAIIGEELGFVGTAAIIVLFILLVWMGILVVKHCGDRFGQLLACGIVLTIALQAAVNIGVVTVVLPTKGIPLPFVSAGGTSMLLSAAAVGILMNIARQSTKQPPGELQ
ncbi:MAG TPA: putative lipid II flippase FtsW [Sedimentisphaerales bacterium]|nr:putative lipid II flippase FtsW [Sedimentisphaerales bacterium]